MSMAQTQTQTMKQRPPGWWYPYIFVAGMGVVIIVNAIMITFAITTWTGLETKDHYRKGVAYNHALAGAQAQAERGWQVDLAFTPDADLKGRVDIAFRDAAGRPLNDLKVEATFFRPTHEGFDSSVELRAQGGGHYAAPAQLPLPGLWEIRILAVGDGPDMVYQDSRRITVR